MKLRIVLMGIMLGVGFSALAMTGPEPMDLSSDEVITLQSSDGKDFIVDLKSALHSETLKNLIKDAGTDDPIPLPGIDSPTLAQVVTILEMLNSLPQEELDSLRNFTITQKQALKTKDQTVRALFFLDIPLVTVLTGSDDQKVLAPVRALHSAQSLKERIRSGIPDIAFTNIRGDTLRTLVQLLSKLDPLLMHNARVAPIDQLFIPRTFQPIANETLKPLANQEIAQLFNAADFTEAPFIVNATAAVIADRIHPSITWPKVESHKRDISTPDQLNLVSQALEKGQFAIPEGMLLHILKHALLRRHNILQEQSVLDYIRAKNENLNITYLNALGESITSLFGIQFFQKLSYLNLGSNYLFDPSLDPQAPKRPFAGMHELSDVRLFQNHLVRIPADFLAEATHLEKLDLGQNNYSSLPANLLDDARELRELAIETTWLIELPDNFLSNQAVLRELNLSGNKIERLQNNLFMHTKKIRKIELGSNQIETIESGTFNNLPDLIEVDLNFNKIATIRTGAFVKCPQLKTIYMHTNNISSIEEGAFQNLPQPLYLLLQKNPLKRLPAKAFLQAAPRIIELRDTNVSPADLEALRKAFPGINLRM